MMIMVLVLPKALQRPCVAEMNCTDLFVFCAFAAGL